MTTECPFSDEEREWIETRVREIVDESSGDESSALELSMGDIDVSDDAEDGPGECPECGSEMVHELGNPDPFCPFCT